MNLTEFGREVTLVFQNPFAQKQLLSAAYKRLRVVYLPGLTLPVANRRNLLSRHTTRGIEVISRAILESVLQFGSRFNLVHSFWSSYFENYLPLFLARHPPPAQTVIEFEDRMGGKERQLLSMKHLGLHH